MATRAVLHRAYGEPAEALTLGEIRLPPPGPSEVLVDVHASTVSGHERLAVQGRPYGSRLGHGLRRPHPRVLGTDFAGRIAGAGSPGGRFRTGDQVFGWCLGAHAEQAIAPAPLVTLRPTNLSAEQAAVAPSAGTTALRAVRDAGGVGPGARVLVIGASGAVGTFAIQIAKAFGATVTGLCSTTNTELVRSIGADCAIDYTLDDLHRFHGGWDVIIDLVACDPLADLRHHLAPDGTLVLIGSPSTGWTSVSRRRSAARLLSAYSRQRLRPLLPRRSGTDLEALRDLMQSGRVTPVVSAHYPLAEVPSALGHFAPGHARGAVAVTV